MYRDVALQRVSSAEPLDKLITLPALDDRAGLLVLAFLLLTAAAILWVTM